MKHTTRRGPGRPPNDESHALPWDPAALRVRMAARGLTSEDIVGRLGKRGYEASSSAVRAWASPTGYTPPSDARGHIARIFGVSMESFSRPPVIE